VFNQTVGA